MQNYEPDVTQLLGLYQQLEDDIVADMVRRMLKMGFVSESTAYQAEVLQTAGILYDDILQMIADRTDASVAQVRAMFEDAGVRTVEIDNDTHEAAGEAPADIRQDGGMKQVLDTGRHWEPCGIWSAPRRTPRRLLSCKPVTGRICRCPPERSVIRMPYAWRCEIWRTAERM